MYPRPLKTTVFFIAGTVFGLLLPLVFQKTSHLTRSLLSSALAVKDAESSVPTQTTTPRPKREVTVHNTEEHGDDDTIAKDLYENVRVLIWVMTEPSSLRKKAVHVKKTWGKRANKLLFMSDKADDSFPAIGLNISHGREHLTMKTMRAFQYIYENHIDDADWFMKVDDDTYVIVENLRHLLAPYDPDIPIAFGHHFRMIVKQGYFSGGGGYVISKEALRRFGRRSYGACVNDSGAEDAEMGKCMEALNISLGESSDKYGRSRFHCFDVDAHLFFNFPDWYYQYDKHGGDEEVSDLPITFHYVSPDHMYAMEYFTYHLRAFGVLHTRPGKYDIYRRRAIAGREASGREASGQEASRREAKHGTGRGKAGTLRSKRKKGRRKKRSIIANGHE